jgi:hypothetical protein
MGLPSHPKDVAAKPKVARAFVVVARKASKKLSSVETGAILARARPDVAPAAIAKLVDSIPSASGASASPKKTTPKAPFTAHGPSRKMIIVNFGPGNNVPGPHWEFVVHGLNNALQQHERKPRLQTGSCNYGGWSLNFDDVPNEGDLNVVRGWLTASYPDLARSIVADPPMSKSYLKLIGVPRYRNALQELTLPSDIMDAFDKSPLAAYINLAAPPRLVKESEGSTVVTAYFDIWDTSTGARSRCLHGKRVIALGRECFIRGTTPQVGVPICQKCWKWGHSTHVCRENHRCARCGQPHRTDEHRLRASCCQGQPKNDPPVPPTPAVMPCPHKHRCLACRKEGHSVTDRKCEFWYARFDRKKIESLYAKVRVIQQRGRTTSNIRTF